MHKSARSRKSARAADSVEKVYQAVRELAVEYHFKPLERANEADLAARLGVSRTPVREALNRLACDGFMRLVPNRGFYARDISPKDVQELYELRAAIERTGFKLACQRGTDDEIAATASRWALNSEQGGRPDWARVTAADEAFHLGIVRMAKNERMFAAVESINFLIRFFRRIDIESDRRDSLYEEHAGIIDCLKRRDADKGCELIERHITLSSAHAVEVTKEGLARIFFGSPRSAGPASGARAKVRRRVR